MKVYCVTHKPQPNIDQLGLIPVGLGINKFPNHYLIENTLKNIAFKNEHYSEISFHYWIWKNILPSKKDGEWFGICQYRRYFVKKEFRPQISQSKGNQGNLKVNSFCQELSASNNWVDIKKNSNDNDNDIKLENAILNKAKKINLTTN